LLNAFRRSYQEASGQRVGGGARAWLPSRPVVLLDEPLARVGPLTARDLQREFGEANARLNRDWLFFTTDVREVLFARLSNRLMDAATAAAEQAGGPFSIENELRSRT